MASWFKNQPALRPANTASPLRGSSRKIASARSGSGTRCSLSPFALALPVLVAQDPRLGAADHFQVEPAPVTVASRLGVPDLRRCQLSHRFILASIPGFVGASSGLYRTETEQRKV